MKNVLKGIFFVVVAVLSCFGGFAALIRSVMAINEGVFGPAVMFAVAIFWMMALFIIGIYFPLKISIFIHAPWWFIFVIIAWFWGGEVLGPDLLSVGWWTEFFCVVVFSCSLGVFQVCSITKVTEKEKEQISLRNDFIVALASARFWEKMADEWYRISEARIPREFRAEGMEENKKE